MAKYIVTKEVSVTFSADVEADSEQEALELCPPIVFSSGPGSMEIVAWDVDDASAEKEDEE